MPRRILFLAVEGLPAARLEELRANAVRAGDGAQVEVMSLTEANGGEALQKIFAADTVAVWGALVDGN